MKKERKNGRWESWREGKRIVLRHGGALRVVGDEGKDRWSLYRREEHEREMAGIKD